MTSDEKRFGVEDPEEDLPENERTTIPPPEGDPREESITPAQVRDVMAEVGVKLSLIEVKLEEVREDVEELHALLLGIPHPNVPALKVNQKTGHIGGIGQVFHDWNTYLTVIAANSEKMLQNHEEYANEVARVHQENIKSQFEITKLKLQVDQLKLLIMMKLTEVPIDKLNEIKSESDE